MSSSERPENGSTDSLSDQELEQVSGGQPAPLINRPIAIDPIITIDDPMPGTLIFDATA